MRFEKFEVRLDERCVIVDGQHVPLGARAFDVLRVLATHYMQVVTKQTLFEQVWPGVVVEENNLQVQISTLRKCLGKDTITTVSGRGYRLMARPVGLLDEAAFARGAPLGSNLATARGNLPYFMPRLYGREADVGAICGLLEQHRLVHLVGPSGVGKTHLAKAVGFSSQAVWPAGVWLVRVEVAHDVPSVVQALAQCLNLAVSNGEAALDEICLAIKDKRLLLILDNCEHVHAAMQHVMARLLEKTLAVHLLSTSQIRPADVHHCVYAVGALAVPEVGASGEEVLQSGAVALLLGSLEQSGSRHAVSDASALAHAAAICRQLDGLALSILLAAARVPMLGLEGVRARLDERMHLLVCAPSGLDGASRHMTLRAALDWSFSLVEPATQVVFCRLGLLTGSFSLEAFNCLLADLDMPEWQLLQSLEGLIAHSLVTVSDDGPERYRLLENHRLYALERLEQSGQAVRWRRHFAQAMWVHGAQLVKKRQTSMLWADMHHFTSAYQWAVSQTDAADQDLAVRLAIKTAMPLAVSGYVDEALSRLLKVQPWVQVSTPSWRVARYWQWLGRCGVHGRLPSSDCLEALARAETIFVQLDDWRRVHACRRMRAQALLDSGLLDQAQEVLQQALMLEDRVVSSSDRIRRIRVQGLWAHRHERLEEALAFLQSALSLAKMEKIDRYALIIELDMANVWLDMGDFARCEQVFPEINQASVAQPYHRLTHAQSYAGWMIALMHSCDLVQAARVCLQALPCWRSSRLLNWHGDVLAWWLALMGHAEMATQMLATTDLFFADAQLARTALQARMREMALALITPEVSPLFLQSCLYPADSRVKQRIAEDRIVDFLETETLQFLQKNGQPLEGSEIGVGAPLQ